MKNTKVLSGLSLFSGAGGMDVGCMQAGIDVVGANDIDRDACLTYEANHPGRSIEQGDINSKTDYIKKFDGVDIVFGGPPCQGFSVSLDKDQVRQVFGREVMKESAIYQEWREENLAEGQIKGQEAERRSIALKMLAEGMSLEVIAKITGYSIKQIQNL